MLESSLLRTVCFGKNWDNVVAAGEVSVYLSCPIFFHRSSLFHRWGLSSEAWAYWSIRTCLTHTQIFQKSFFSKTAQPNFLKSINLSNVNLEQPKSTGIGLGHSLWHLRPCGRGCPDATVFFLGGALPSTWTKVSKWRPKTNSSGFWLFKVHIWKINWF